MEGIQFEVQKNDVIAFENEKTAFAQQMQAEMPAFCTNAAC